MWQLLDPENTEHRRALARDFAHTILFIVAVVMLVVGGILTSPADLGLIAAAVGILGLVGIVRA